VRGGVDALAQRALHDLAGRGAPGVGSLDDAARPLAAGHALAAPIPAVRPPVTATSSIAVADTWKPGSTVSPSAGDVIASVGAIGSALPSRAVNSCTEFWFARHVEPPMPHARFEYSPHATV